MEEHPATQLFDPLLNFSVLHISYMRDFPGRLNMPNKILNNAKNLCNSMENTKARMIVCKGISNFNGL